MESSYNMQSPHMLFAMQGHLDKNSPNPGFVLLTFYNLHEGKVRNFGQISDAQIGFVLYSV
jgi:hypothetical protein